MRRFGLDYLLTLASLWVAHLLLEYPKLGKVLPADGAWVWIAFLGGLLGWLFFCLYVADVIRRHDPLNLSLALAATWVGLAVFAYFTKFELGRDVLLLSYLLSLSALWATRKFPARQVRTRACLCLEPGSLFEELARQPEFAGQHEVTTASNLHDPARLRELLARSHSDLILLDVSARQSLPDRVLEELINLKFEGVQVSDLGGYFEDLTGRVPLLHLPGSWFLDSKLLGESYERAFLRGKRIWDIGLSLSLLIALAPIVLLAALLTKLTSEGPAFYMQERVGLGDRKFTIYKIRSMCDGEVTSWGCFIRSCRLDELPQLWNVLRGDMSFIGPRPEQPHIVRDCACSIPYYELRHAIRPGISGWAQVCAPYATAGDALQKLEYDLYYLRNMGLKLEIKILLRTARVLLRRMGK